jgi:ketosteroid isomerase-like protein
VFIPAGGGWPAGIRAGKMLVHRAIGKGRLVLAMKESGSEREKFLTWVRSDLTDAEVALHNGDAGPRCAIWSTVEPVTVLGAWKTALGRAEAEKLFVLLADSFSNCTAYSFDVVAADVAGDMGYTAGYERASLSVNGVARSQVLRVTQIYRREGGVWKVAHRHGDLAPGVDQAR